MARINIEDDWIQDPRRLDLVSLIHKELKVGFEAAELMADGLAIRIWRLAQSYHKKDQKIPQHIFKRITFSDLFIQCELACVKSDGVYVNGSNDSFLWLKQRQEAGRKGGLKVSKRKQTEASSSSSSSSSVSNTKKRIKENTKNGEQGNKEPKNSPTPVASSSDAYSNTVVVFDKLWQRYPMRNGRRLGKAPALKAFCKLIAVSEHQDFGKAVANYAKHCEKTKSFAKDMVTFINQEIWRDIGTEPDKPKYWEPRKESDPEIPSGPL